MKSEVEDDIPDLVAEAHERSLVLGIECAIRCGFDEDARLLVLATEHDAAFHEWVGEYLAFLSNRHDFFA